MNPPTPLRPIITAVVLLLALQASASSATDSLYSVWLDVARPDTVRLQALHDYTREAFINSDPDSAISLAGVMLDYAERKGLKRFIASALNLRGNAHLTKGDLEPAFNDYTRSLQIREAIGDRVAAALSLNNIGLVYNRQGNLAKAAEYYTRSLKIQESVGNRAGMAIALANIGTINKRQGDLELAMENLGRSLAIHEALGNTKGASQSLSSIASIHSDLGHYALAIENYDRSLQLAEKTGDRVGMSQVMLNRALVQIELGDTALALASLQRTLQMKEEMGEKEGIAITLRAMAYIHHHQGDDKEAIQVASRALRIAQEAGAVVTISDVAGALFESYKAVGKPDSALKLYELHISMRDSVAREENERGVMQQRFQYDYEKKEALAQAEQDKKDAVAAEELRRKNLQRNAFIGGFGLMLLLAGTFFVQRNRVNKARKRSDELLLNILPEEVAEELKAKGEADAKQIDQVTVLFTDFKGFTAMSEQLTPKELVRDIHECFSAFDRIMEKHGIEKIKTIGDAYMAAGGLPTPNTTHALDVVMAAFEIQAFIAEGKAHKVAAGLPYFEIRIGIHTGPVVAGIVGLKKFAYDIWGDTVNIASRMESSGDVGQVNISEATYALVKDAPGLNFIPRGKVQAKGKGVLEMYFVDKGK